MGSTTEQALDWGPELPGDPCSTVRIACGASGANYSVGMHGGWWRLTSTPTRAEHSGSLLRIDYYGSRGAAVDAAEGIERGGGVLR